MKPRHSGDVWVVEPDDLPEEEIVIALDDGEVVEEEKPKPLITIYPAQWAYWRDKS